MVRREGECVKTGAVSLTLIPNTGSVGCALIDLMRRVTPKGAAKPWRTRENIEFIDRVAGAGVPRDEIEAYIRGCSEVVEAREEQAIYWTVRQLFSSPTMDWWRGRVADRAHRAELKTQYELDTAARDAREAMAREGRREAAKSTPADLGIRRETADLRAAVVNRARGQELAAGLLDRLRGGASASSGCPACSVQVAIGDSSCPACGAQIIDDRGIRRVGLRGV